MEIVQNFTEGSLIRYEVYGFCCLLSGLLIVTYSIKYLCQMKMELYISRILFQGHIKVGYCSAKLTLLFKCNTEV